MVLVSSPDGVLLGAGKTVSEVKAIMKRASLEFNERRRREMIHELVVKKIVEQRPSNVDELQGDICTVFEKLRVETRKFIDDCKLEEVE